jgi:hypothetical protein
LETTGKDLPAGSFELNLRGPAHAWDFEKTIMPAWDANEWNQFTVIESAGLVGRSATPQGGSLTAENRNSLSLAKAEA